MDVLALQGTEVRSKLLNEGISPKGDLSVELEVKRFDYLKT